MNLAITNPTLLEKIEESDFTMEDISNMYADKEGGFEDWEEVDEAEFVEFCEEIISSSILEIDEFEVGLNGCGGWIFAANKKTRKYFSYVQEERINENDLMQFYVAGDGSCVAINTEATEYETLEEALELEGFTEKEEEEEERED